MLLIVIPKSFDLSDELNFQAIFIGNLFCIFPYFLSESL